MAANKKNELIQKTYELLKTSSPQDVTIRAIASAANCTSTTIYKHFDDLDHLILFASVKFLEDYIIDLQNIISKNTDTLNMFIAMWKSFAKYAFANIEVFELLFWGKNKNGLGDTIFEYYQLFPNEWRNLDGLFTSVFFNDNLEERNSIMMHRAATTGYFTYDDAQLLSDLQCCMFHGLLLEYKDKYRSPQMAEEGARRFMDMLNSLISRYRTK